MNVPKGFLWAAFQAGIKPNRKDLALVFSESPCAAAACFTRNLAKAAPVLDAEKRLPAEAIQAVDTLDPATCRREGENRFSANRMFEQYLQLYEDVVSGIPEARKERELCTLPS